MNLNKSQEFFDPTAENICNKQINIIGCGAVGSTLAEILARTGLTKFQLWDMDVVNAHNIANQMFTEADVGASKTEAVKRIMTEINPYLKNTIETKDAWTKQDRLKDYVFIAVDNIDLRKDIVKTLMYNPAILGVFDIRMSLKEGTIYAADWKNEAQKKALLATMNYTHEEAKAETPVSACGFELSVAPTVRTLCSYQVANFMNFIKGDGLKKFGIVNTFNFFTEFYDA